MNNPREELSHYLRTGEVTHDPHDNPAFIRLLNRFLVRRFSPLERDYPDARQNLLLGSHLPNLTAAEIT